jgi:hypothetical protein
MNHAALFLAVAYRPLFGNQWLALLAVLAGVALFMVAIAVVGRWLAATHPETPGRAACAAPAAAPAPTPSNEIVAVIAASIAAHLGSRARITAIRPAPVGPTVEMLMQQWSLEGRRQIYSSHQVR